ncbi:PREDICTED: serine/threonine-protein kinase-like protein CCR4 [Nelumbo nucifera]|uniref:non-specific serine/threonine protein kinase n=2 Tax=Nelumbo nucifera TaxID=4432 RepID=A0A1U7YPU0_NELNU|nr:PREDICTED: serine/threonine-protein kinase-like protein CCR4 [Nelumbo nucifera]DAD39000.1 TPA_asm: hypothetical protein HUJ06_013323 [Nelumbo nucifera]
MASHKHFSLLLLVSLFFVSNLPILSSSLSTVSISENSNFTLICALVPGQDKTALPSLNCTSFPSGIPFTPANPNFPISATAAGIGFLCVLRTSPSSSLLCWRFSGNGTVTDYKRIYKGRMLDELDAGESHICGRINGSGRIQCWQWRGPNFPIDRNLSRIAVGGDFACGLSETGKIDCFGDNPRINQSKPMANYSFVAAGLQHACAISVNGSIDCWPGEGVGNKPVGEFTSLALGNNRSCAIRADETVVCWGEHNFSLPESLQQLQFVSITAKSKVFCGALKRNYSLFCWGNDSFQSNYQVSERVLPGACRTDCPCELPDSTSFCSQGAICAPCGSRPPTAQNPPETPPALPPLAPESSPSTPSNGLGRARVAFFVIGCIGTVSLASVLGFWIYRYCKGRVCRVHDSGRLDEPGPGATPAAGPSQRQTPDPQPPPTSPSFDKRLSKLLSMGPAGSIEEFSLQVLNQATDNFSEEFKIGSGSFGAVYRATLEDGREVAIKRAELSASSSYAGLTKRHEDKENAFLSELALLSRLNHKNLVRLLGYCEEANERVLVYEFMDNGTLHDHLHKLESSDLMSWPARLKVALDAARGIEYLHNYAVPPIIHRDIKSSNILLDATWTAKVSDFGLSLMGPEDEDSHLSLRAAGTVGYMDPEYYRLQQLSTKSDVYSFGVVLLELLSGHKAIHRQEETGMPRNVVDVVMPYIVADEIHRVLDRRLRPPTPVEIEAVAYVGYLAADCVGLEGRDRPSMTEIVNSLDRALKASLVSPNLSRSTTGSSTR